jgi:hypothetical protein
MRVAATFVAFCVTAGLALAGDAGLKTGKVDLKSAGALAFGPNGLLFVGDTMGASVLALETGDKTPARSAGAVEIKGINQKVAALLGTTADQILIQDVVVNPISRNTYLSVARGRGPDALPVILRIDSTGKLSELSLDNVPHARVSLADAPGVEEKDRRGNSKRLETITDLAYVNGKVIIAGLSNEEFSSTLRSISYPFQQADKGAGIEIYHGNHGRFETNAPVRTFVPYSIGKQPHILAAYTCTPLVKIPLSDLKPGAKVKGTTIAELGNRNRPIDMIVYKKDGREFILMANSARGVMKLPAEGLDSYKAITAPVEEKEGVPYETIASLKGVQQMDKFDDRNALLLVDDGGSVNLRTVPLP